MSQVRITEYTDPGCPWAWSAEPARRRLNWIYGNEIEWQIRMVVLAESTAHYEDMDFTAEKAQEFNRDIAAEHGMPIDSSLRSHVPATGQACRAVVAARLNAPILERQMLRCLRVEYFAGGMLDSGETIDAAIASAGLDIGEVRGWMKTDEVEDAIAQDKEMARRPMPAARALDHKLANWSGGRRYTCPSYEIERLSDGVKISIPGFQPFAAYDVTLANLIPDTERREPPESATEVLERVGTPLATQEVAAVMDIDRADAREQLGRVAEERHVGADGFWSLPD